MEIRKEILGGSEISQDYFFNYRRKYPGGKKSDNTWGGRLERIVKTVPNKLAFVQGDRRLTWKQFDEEVNRFANALVDLGIKKEERVGIAGFNSIEWMVSYFAISRIGAVPFDLNPQRPLEELSYVIEDADAAAMIVEDEYAPIIERVTRGIVPPRHLIVCGIGRSPQHVPSTAVAYGDLVAKYPPTKPRLGYEVTNEDFCSLVYTEGPTAYPRGKVWDGETKVRGVERLIYNGFLPIIARINEEKVFALANTIFPLPKHKALHPLMRRLFSLGISRMALAKLVGKFVGGRLLIKLGRRVSSEGFKFLPVCPLFLGSAYNQTLGQIVAYGTCTVFLRTPYPFSPTELLETIEKERVNGILIAGDTHAIPILEELQGAKKEGRAYDLSSLMCITSLGVRLAPRILRELHKYMPQVVVINAYGCAEVSIAYSIIATSADEEISGAGAMLPARGGVYSLQAPCKVIDPETGKEVRPGSGEIGEFIAGGYVCLGYWKRPGQTKSDFRVIDGQRYFFTGDDGYVDEGWQFHLVGKGGEELINTGEEKVYSEEVKEVIKSHPEVRDVGVVGIPDDELGEAVAAIIEVVKGGELTARDVIDYCSQSLPGYKIPKHVMFAVSLPRAATGKMERTILKEFVGARLGGEG